MFPDPLPVCRGQPMQAVDQATFFAAIGPKNCHPHIEGTYPYTSIFFTPARVEVGRIVQKDKVVPVYYYFLPGDNACGLV